MTDFTLAIIAGGKSSRMGTDKAFVTLADKPMIEHVIERTADIGQSGTILITNNKSAYAHLNLPMYTDIQQEKGSLGGIYTAISHSKTPYTLVVACDMPFLNPDLLKFMVAQISEDVDIVVPRVEGYPQGLHAIYSKTCLDPIENQLDEDRLKIIRFYDQVRVRYLDEADYAPFAGDGHAFTNLNTPEELKAAQEKSK